MKVLEFAFDDRDDSAGLPHAFPERSICYTGTHDNSPLALWRGKYQLFPKPEKVDICLLKGHLLFYGTDYAVSLPDAASRSGTASSGHRT